MTITIEFNEQENLFFANLDIGIGESQTIWGETEAIVLVEVAKFLDPNIFIE